MGKIEVVQRGAELLPESQCQLMSMAGRMLADALQDIDQIVISIDLMQAASDNQALHDPDVFGPELGLINLLTKARA